MKILHTADWHMNSTLGRQNLKHDIIESLRQIGSYLEAHQVDVLLVAGDLFSEQSRDEGMLDAVSSTREIFGPFVARGGTILAVAGNHDSELKFETLRQALLLGSGQNFVLTANPQTVNITSRDGQTVQFALLPYPTARAYLKGEANYSTLAGKNRLVQNAFAEKLAELKNELNPNLPAVLVSHIHVRGAQSHSLYRVSESDDVIFDAQQIPLDWTYAAYGHIHKPGPAVSGAPHVRYSGSPIALDAAERFDSKGCVLFEIDNNNRVGEIEILPLNGPKIHQIVFDITQNTFETELANWKSEIKPSDLVHYTLRFNASDHPNIPALQSEIERHLGRVYGRELEKIGAQIGQAALIPTQNALGADAPQMVREFLTKRLSEHEERDAILKMAEELMAE